MSKTCTYAEHVVHARGKRTQFTSVSLDPKKIWDLGETLYRLLLDALLEAKHILIDHDKLVKSLINTVKNDEGKERDIAIRAIRRVKRRKEALIEWRFNIRAVERKDLIPWAFNKVNNFFTKV